MRQVGVSGDPETHARPRKARKVVAPFTAFRDRRDSQPIPNPPLGFSARCDIIPSVAIIPNQEASV
jgi:hypothetical protein